MKREKPNTFFYLVCYARPRPVAIVVVSVSLRVEVVVVVDVVDVVDVIDVVVVGIHAAVRVRSFVCLFFKRFSSSSMGLSAFFSFESAIEILPSFSNCGHGSRLFSCGTEFHWVAPRFYRIFLPSFSGFHSVLPGFTGL